MQSGRTAGEVVNLFLEFAATIEKGEKKAVNDYWKKYPELQVILSQSIVSIEGSNDDVMVQPHLIASVLKNCLRHKFAKLSSVIWQNPLFFRFIENVGPDDEEIIQGILSACEENSIKNPTEFLREFIGIIEDPMLREILLDNLEKNTENKKLNYYQRIQIKYLSLQPVYEKTIFVSPLLIPAPAPENEEIMVDETKKEELIAKVFAEPNQSTSSAELPLAKRQKMETPEVFVPELTLPPVNSSAAQRPTQLFDFSKSSDFPAQHFSFFGRQIVDVDADEEKPLTPSDNSGISLVPVISNRS